MATPEIPKFIRFHPPFCFVEISNRKMQIHADSEADSVDPNLSSSLALRSPSDLERHSAVDLDVAVDPLLNGGDGVECDRDLDLDLDVDAEHNVAEQDVAVLVSSSSSSSISDSAALPSMALSSGRSPWYLSVRNWVKLNVLFFVIALLISALSQPELVLLGVQALLQWMERHIVCGSMVFMSLYIICELLMFPCLVLLFGAGFVFCNVLHSMIKGLFLSTAIVFVAELVASTMAFLMARYLMRSNIKKMAAKYPKFQVIDAAVKRYGFRVTLLFRMSPLTPYNLFNCNFTLSLPLTLSPSLSLFVFTSQCPNFTVFTKFHFKNCSQSLGFKVNSKNLDFSVSLDFKWFSTLKCFGISKCYKISKMLSF